MHSSVFVDLETTGTNPAKDRICQIAIIKIDGSEWDSYVNPQMPIPQDSIQIHGITDAMVKDSPKFEDIADIVIQTLEEAEIFVAYNALFDFQVLQYELFNTVKYNLCERDFIFVDPYKIFKTQFPQNLSNAYKFYTGKDLVNAHSAIVDIRATKEILDKQKLAYPEFFKQPPKLIEEQTLGDMSIIGKWFKQEKGKIVFSQGKFKGIKVETGLRDHANYLKWIHGLEDTSLSEKRYIESTW